MRIKLQKHGNATALIIPDEMLTIASLTSGVELSLSAKHGCLTISNLSYRPRSGWAESAARLMLPEEIQT